MITGLCAPFGSLSSQPNHVNQLPQSRLRLTAEDLQHIDRILASTIKDPVGPEFMDTAKR